MEAFTELFLHKVFLHDALAPYKMSFLIPDVFLPLDDPTFNDILNHDNYDPGEDPFQWLMNDTDFLLAQDRVTSSLAAFRHRSRVTNLASVSSFWFQSCLSSFRDSQFLALYRMAQISTRWNIPASVRTLDGDQQMLLYEFSGRLCRQLRLTCLINPLDEH